MVSLSKRNKRTSLHQKYKVAKKVRQHHKKQRKSLKNAKPKKQLPISLQIPMEHPCKNQIIEEIEKNMSLDKQAEKQQLKESKKIQIPKALDELQKLRKKALENTDVGLIAEIKKVIDRSDLVMCVLDARDPMGTRSLEYESLIKSQNKTLIFILNKIDLVPLDNVKAWCNALSEVGQTFPFKSRIERTEESIKKALKSLPQTYGESAIIDYLKSLGDQNSRDKKLVIGIVGVPNVGKSSFINSIKKKKITCEVGPEPGSTKKMSQVDISNNIVLIDSPGFVLKALGENLQKYALRNFFVSKKIENRNLLAQEIFNRYKPDQFLQAYSVRPLATFDEFMKEFATQKCQLKKKGIPNMKLAELKLIDDWNKGKLKHYTEAPAHKNEGAGLKTFDVNMECFTLNEKYNYSGVTVLQCSEPVQVFLEINPLKTVADEEEEESEDVEMDE